MEEGLIAQMFPAIKRNEQKVRSKYRVKRDGELFIVVRWEGPGEAPHLDLDAERENPKTLWSFLRHSEAVRGFDLPAGFETEEEAWDAVALAEQGPA